ncbi:MAG: hypothetical protein R2799_01215 [Crocinitomicaceae bacterium]
MTITKSTLFAVLGLTYIGISCQRHQIVPAPEPPVDQVEVDCMFQGHVDTTDYTLQEGTNSFACNLLVTKNIQPSPLISSAIYTDSLGSTSASIDHGIRLDLGSFDWVDDGSNNPSMSEFQTFFSGANLMAQFGDSVNLPFSNGGANGVQITWVDENGIAFYSRDTSTYPGTFFVLNNVTYEADNDNEYVKWSALFTAELWNYNGTDSIVVQNGIFNGAFRRRTQ